jgi:hypothetical protein
MTEIPPTSPFEEEIRAAVAAPPAREEFVKSLHGRILQQAAVQPRQTRPIFFRPAWAAAVLLVVLAVTILAVDPRRVLAAIRGLFGYIPGVGIVDQSVPFRVLAEPVTVTRDGISITVTSALLTGEQTHIEYRIFGVPGSAYPDREDVLGCTEPEYLRLPDGTRLNRAGTDFGFVPAGINTATFVMPCIFNTLPGKTPENWELPLRFKPAPPDLTVMPVIELSPSSQANQTPELAVEPSLASPTIETKAASTQTLAVANAVTVTRVVETKDGYILIGQFQPHLQPGKEFQQTGEMKIWDARGYKVPYSFPQDIQFDAGNLDQGVYGWSVQFKAAGLVYPLTITVPGVQILPADPAATAEFSFDAGPNPQPGQEWTPGQEVQLAGHTLKVVSISADSRNGYSFIVHVDPEVFGAAFEIVGYASNGGGGGGGGGLTDGQFNVSQSFAQLPTGILKVRVSNLTILGAPITFQGQWAPETPRTDLPANPTQPPGLCLTADTLAQLEPAASTLFHGKALVFEQLTDSGKWGLVLYDLDGSRRQVVTENGNWGALSPDGGKVAYSASDNGIHVVDVSSMTDQAIPNASGFDIHWSADATQIAYIGMGDGVVNSAYIAKLDGTLVRQVSDLSYETIIGWTADGAQLYFAAPFTGGAAWKVYSYDTVSGTTKERFTLENGTPKFLNPMLSPDGKWIAYRGRDNASLYMVHPDGSGMRLVLDSIGAFRGEWSWAGWLEIGIQDLNSNESTVLLLKPDGCEAYRLPGVLPGELEGLMVR